MDSYDREPSYYEVSLTNRQVVAGFVILLVCVFGAFLSGVWMGRGDEAPEAVIAAAPAAPPADPARERLEQLTFFGDREAGDRRAAPTGALPPAAAEPAAPPAAAAPTPAETEAEKLRLTLEAEMAAHRAADAAVDAPAAAASPAAAAPAPGARVQRAPASAAPAAKASAAPAAATAPATAASGAVWIQVYSSANAARAREIASRLRTGGFEVRILEGQGGAGATFRVRVGPYANRSAADGAAARLRRDFRLDTWVTDSP